MEKTSIDAKKDIKSQLDTIKQDVCKIIKQKTQDSGINGSRYDEESNEFLKETQKRTDAILAEVDESHELYLNLILIKAFCVIRTTIDLMIRPEEFVRMAEPNLIECQTLLNPFKNRAEGVGLYVLCQALHVQLIQMRTDDKSCDSSETQAEYRKGLELIEDADKLYKDFVHNSLETPWGMNEIFCCHDDEGNQIQLGLTDDYRNLHESVWSSLIDLAIRTVDESKIRKYGVDGLKFLLICNRNHNQILKLVRYAMNIAQSFINVYYYAQAQHIIAVTMHTVVEFRRSLPEEKRTTVNPIQYVASYLFALLGYSLTRKSHELVREQKLHRSLFGLEIQDLWNIHHDDCHRLMPESADLNQYENQFPTKLIPDEKIFKTVQKKTRQWLARMEELKRTNTAPLNIPSHLEREVPIIEMFSNIPY